MASADCNEVASKTPPRHRLIKYHDHAGEHALVGFESESIAVAVFVAADLDPQTIDLAFEDLAHELEHELSEGEPHA